MIVGMQAKETGDGAGRGSKLWVAPKTPYSLRLYEVFGNTIRERERMGAGGGEGGRRFTVIDAHHFSVIVLFVTMTEQGEGHMRHSWRVQHKRVPARVQFHPLVGPALSSVLSFSLSHQYFNPRSGQHKRMLLPSSLCSSMRDVQQANHLLWRTRLTETAY